MKLETRTFKAQLFWDPVAWVAETVDNDYWYVAQGSTPDQAVERLKRGLSATASLQLDEGHVPFSDRLAPPADTWRRHRKAVPRVSSPKRGKTHHFIVTACWSSDTKLRPVKGRRRLGHNR